VGKPPARTFSYAVVEECTAFALVFLYGAAVLAYPATWRQRVVGLAVGIPALFALNLIRLVTLAWVGLHIPERFEAVHLYWWQGFLIAFTGLGWFAWARFVAHEGRHSQGGTARIREVFARSAFSRSAWACWEPSAR
jgi:archaeosortase B (VPXXXP-CTERM-specific)